MGHTAQDFWQQMRQQQALQVLAGAGQTPQLAMHLVAPAHDVTLRHAAAAVQVNGLAD